MSEFFDFVMHNTFDQITPGVGARIMDPTCIGHYSNIVSIEDYSKYHISTFRIKEIDEKISILCKKLSKLYDKMFKDRKPEYIDEYNGYLENINKLHKEKKIYENTKSDIYLTGLI